MTVMSGLFAIIKWSVCTAKSQRILQESFSMTACGWCSYHIGLIWVPFALQISHHKFPNEYGFWANHAFFYTLSEQVWDIHTLWLIVSSALLHIQYFFCSCDFWIFPIIKLVRMASSEVFCFKLYGPFSQLLPPILISHLVCCTNWPCNIVSSQEIFRSFFCLLASIVASGIASTKLVFTDLAAVS